MKTARILVATALATSLLGATAPPAAAQDPCYQHTLPGEAAKWVVCMVIYLTK